MEGYPNQVPVPGMPNQDQEQPKKKFGNQRPKVNTEVVNLTMPTVLKQRLDGFCESNDLSRAHAIRKALKDFLAGRGF